MTFEPHRRRLLSLAYRILGSWSEAEDVVQDAFVRFNRQSPGTIDDVAAWLDRVVANLCLDVLKSSRVQREQYVGPWLPEPVLTDGPLWSAEPFDPTTLSLAFMALLERLSPLERAAYILAEAFDYSSDEIAQVLGRDPMAVRQLLHRAREHIRQERPRFAPNKVAHKALLTTFLGACSRGDMGALEKLLAEGVSLHSDGGGRVRAALKSIRGVNKVARFVFGVMPKVPTGAHYELREINGWPALVVYEGDKPFSVLHIETDGAQIFSILVVVNPEKLQTLRFA